MSLHYFEKLKIINFALFVHVKHLSNVIFIIYPTDIYHYYLLLFMCLSNLSNVIKIVQRLTLCKISTFHF